MTARKRHDSRPSPVSPSDLGTDALVVTYDAPATLGYFLSRGWPMPGHVLDLHAEFHCLTSGILGPGDYSLADALAHHGLSGDGLDGLELLLDVLWDRIDWPRALLRGRYGAAVARMEAVGIPIDVESLERLRHGWDHVRDALISQVEGQYGRIFDAGKFSPRRWRAWLNRHRIRWPRDDGSGKLKLNLDTFRDMADAYPVIRPMKELRATLALLGRQKLTIGSDGRNRCPLRPFASKTGRNQPSTSEFIFGPATWLRGLIKPEESMALAYIDYEQQEFGIAAALSGDQAMAEAYRSGDPYLTFAIQAGAAPPNATKQTYREVRDRFKHCALGVQYSMQEKSLAVRLGVPVPKARELLRLHKATYSTYWRWSEEVGRRARKDGKLIAAMGWTLNVGQEANPRSVRNFPLQGNGSEMLRLACILLTEAGVRVCAPVHDALLVEAPIDEIDEVVATCRQAMAKASEVVLDGFQLRTESKVVRYPDRYMDDRGGEMWDLVFGLLGGEVMAGCALEA